MGELKIGSPTFFPAARRRNIRLQTCVALRASRFESRQSRAGFLLIRPSATAAQNTAETASVVVAPVSGTGITATVCVLVRDGNRGAAVGAKSV